MVKTTEDRRRVEPGARWTWERGEVSGSIGCLHMEPTMRTAVVVGHLLPEDALRVALVARENVACAASAYCPDRPLTECVRLRGARRRDEGPDAETANALSKGASEMESRSWTKKRGTWSVSATASISR